MKKGFTLVESILVILIVGIMSVLFSFYILVGINSWEFSIGQKNLSRGAWMALNRMVREIRRIKGNTDILTWETSALGFIDIDDEDIFFRQSGTNLLRNSAVLMEDLMDPGGLVLTYLNESGGTVAAKSEIEVIRVKIRGITSSNIYTIEASSRLRN